MRDLRVDEGDGIQHSTMTEINHEEYYRRVRMILKTELHASNTYQALNFFAVPIVTYSFNIKNRNKLNYREMTGRHGKC